MEHRLRAAMTKIHAGPMGGSGQIVEADETYFGNEPGKTKKTRGKAGGAMKDMNKIVSLVEREGEVRSFHVAND